MGSFFSKQGEKQEEKSSQEAIKLETQKARQLEYQGKNLEAQKNKEWEIRRKITSMEDNGIEQLNKDLEWAMEEEKAGRVVDYFKMPNTNPYREFKMPYSSMNDIRSRIKRWEDENMAEKLANLKKELEDGLANGFKITPSNNTPSRTNVRNGVLTRGTGLNLGRATRKGGSRHLSKLKRNKTNNKRRKRTNRKIKN